MTASPSTRFSNADFLVLAGFVLLGFVGSTVWLLLGHPRTHAFSTGFFLLMLLAGASLLVAPAGRRQHTCAVLSCGAFLAKGSTMLLVNAYALTLAGTDHSADGKRIAASVLLLAFFGALPLSQRRMFTADRALRPDVAAKAAALTPAGRRLLAAHLHLANGTTVRGAVVDGYAQLPKGIPASSVVDLTPRRR